MKTPNITKEGRIYFVFLVLSETVHCIPGGFTDSLDVYAMASDEAEAITKAKEHFARKGVTAIRNASARIARIQDPQKYTSTIL